MIKKNLFLIFLFILPIIILNCNPRYKVIQEDLGKGGFDKYKKIYVGWLDFDESKWEEYKYETKTQWLDTIKDMNVIGLQKYVKDKMPEKKVDGAKSKNDKPKKKGKFLYIKFNKPKEYGMEGNYWYMIVNVQFLDGKSGKNLFKGKVKVTNVGAFGSGWALEARFTGFVDNLANYIRNKIKDSGDGSF